MNVIGNYVYGTGTQLVYNTALILKTYLCLIDQMKWYFYLIFCFMYMQCSIMINIYGYFNVHGLKLLESYSTKIALLALLAI